MEINIPGDETATVYVTGMVVGDDGQPKPETITFRVGPVDDGSRPGETAAERDVRVHDETRERLGRPENQPAEVSTLDQVVKQYGAPLVNLILQSAEYSSTRRQAARVEIAAAARRAKEQAKARKEAKEQAKEQAKATSALEQLEKDGAELEAKADARTLAKADNDERVLAGSTSRHDVKRVIEKGKADREAQAGAHQAASLVQPDSAPSDDDDEEEAVFDQ